MRIKDELSRPVRPLTLPPQALAPSVDELQRNASVRLLADRAIAIEPNFTVTRRNAWAVVEICRRLDGIPLALELAAARANALSPEQIASRVDDGLRLLTGGSRTALPRHQTLRATFDWSYELLPERDRRVFGRLAVFAGSWTLQAAEAIAAGDELEATDILDSLAALIDASLVTVEGNSGEHRYRLLETIRQYAREHLLAKPGAAEVQRRHLEWYLGLAERSDPERHWQAKSSSNIADHSAQGCQVMRRCFGEPIITECQYHGDEFVGGQNLRVALTRARSMAAARSTAGCAPVTCAVCAPSDRHRLIAD